MSSKFFTNQDKSSSLESKLQDILEDEKPEYLEFLIGYFRISGFSKIVNFLSNIKELKILVGINIDNATFNAVENTKQIKEKFTKEQLEIYKEDTNKDKYNNIELLSQMLMSEKVKMRIYNTNNLHAKMYILRDEIIEQRTGLRYSGSVITGSSNLTHSGLSSEGNIEINVELKDSDDIKFAFDTFNDTWNNQSREFTKDDVDNLIMSHIEEPKQKEITPYHLYIKLLIEHFGNRVELFTKEDKKLPNGYDKFNYQTDAVNDGIEKLTIHNGFFLSDVVGLGKTIVVAMIVKKLEDIINKKILVVAPPAVIQQWKSAFEDFGVQNYEIESIGNLENISADDYEFVIVDESHKFKNQKSARYIELERICKTPTQKKVILISATPQNNAPQDIASQLYLFQDKKNSSISSCMNLEEFFSKVNSRYKIIIESKDKTVDINSLKEIAIEMRDTILREVMVRRTRTDLTQNMYKDDIKKMPEARDIKEHEYLLEGDLAEVFSTTADMLENKLNYARFKALNNLTADGRIKYSSKNKDISDNIFNDNPLATLMKMQLIKRFESSFHAFKISLEKQLNRTRQFIANYEKNIIYLGDKSNEFLDYPDEYSVKNGVLKHNEKNKELKGHVFVKNDFEKIFITLLKDDLDKFEELWGMWNKEERDPKIEKFEEELLKHSDTKTVVFTESKDTANYLLEKLQSKFKILKIDGQNREIEKENIAKNFDENYKDQEDNYNVIITTDTLSEGINLHRANIIYNYDIPWNATKLMQRIGRINRVGSKADFYEVHNFKPSARGEELIKLSQKAYVKLQSFHTTFGEDNKVYTQDEEVSTHSLFSTPKEQADERDEELDYLNEIREFKNSNLVEFLKIQNLKDTQNVQRVANENCSYIFLKNNHNKSYYKVNVKETKKVSFLEVAKALRAKPDAVGVKIDSELTQTNILKAIQVYKTIITKQLEVKEDKISSTKSDQLTRRLLNYWYKKDILDEKQYEKCDKLVLDGVLSTFNKQVKKLENSTKEEIVKSINKILSSIEIENKNSVKINIKTVLSSTFTKA